MKVEFFGGVFVAIIAGVVLNLGSLIQKKAVNQFVYDKKKALILNEEFDKDKYPQKLHSEYYDILFINILCKVEFL